MPRLIDLTHVIPPGDGEARRVAVEERPIAGGGARYTGVVYRFAHDSMAGTYIDFPGHIRETDDGRNAADWPLEGLYRLDAAVAHLDRASGSGAVTAADLAAACEAPARGGALVVNALGRRRYDEIEHRSVYLSADAVDWIAGTGIRLFVSDIYESKALHGVFPGLFRAGVATVCCPVNLHLLEAPRVRLTALFPRFEKVTQLPCRLVAETED